MPDTGWTLPSANTQEVSGATVWNFPDRLHNLTDEASMSVGNLYTNEQRSWHNFGLGTGDIPSGATITGIEVEIYANGGNAHIADITLETGGSKGTTTHQINIGTTYTYFTVGGSSDMWGLANTSDSDFRSNGFKVHYQPDYTTGNATFTYCRYVRVKVHYIDQPTGDGAITTGSVTLSGSGVVRATGLPVLPSAPEITLVGEDMQSGTGTSLTFNLPGDIEADDFALCVLKADSQTVTTNTSAPAGWTALVDSEIHTGGRDRMSSIYYRKLDGTETTVEMTIDRSDQFSGTMTVFRGVDTTTPFDIGYTSSNGENNVNPAAPGITTLNAGTVVYTFHNFTHDDHTALGAPSGYTLTGGRISSTLQHGGHAAAWRTVPTSQAETPGVWTHTTNGTTVAEYSCYTMALRKSQAPVADVAGRGDVGVPVATVSGSGVVGGGVIGSGAISPAPVTLSGAGIRSVTGSGAITPSPVDLDGAGDVTSTITGTGAVTNAPVELSGTAERAVTGTGAVTNAPVEVNGTGERAVTGTGSLTNAPVDVDGAGTRAVAGTGSVINPPIDMDGDGTRAVNGSASIVLAPMEVEGYGTVGNDVIGVGAIDLAAPVTVSGTGERVVTGAGAVTLAALQASGVGIRFIPGSGAITVGPIEVSGSGGRTLTGSGAISPAPVTVSGTGTAGEVIAGSGAITTIALTLAGVAERIITASGDITVEPLTLSGSGDVMTGITGSGDVTLPAVTVAAIAERIIDGSGVIVLPATEMLGLGSDLSTGRIASREDSENTLTLDESENDLTLAASENTTSVVSSQNMVILAVTKNFVILTPESENDVE